MLNKVTLIGNLGADPEVRYLPNGDAVASVSIATSRRWKDKQTGERKDAVEWHRVIMFRKLAEIAGEYLKKGSQVYVEGRLQTRKWQGQDGKDNYTTEIIANELVMLGGNRRDSDEDEQGGAKKENTYKPGIHRGEMPPARNNAPPMPDNFADFDDDIPFMRIQHEYLC